MRPLIPDSLLDQLHAIIPDTLAAQRKTARNSARYTDWNTGQGSRASNAEKRVQALLLRGEGLTTRQIAQQLEVAQTTVLRWLK